MKSILNYVAGIAIALLLFSVQAKAQVGFGLKAGANYASIYDQHMGPDFHATPKAGFAGGAFVSIPIIPFIGIQPEVMFSQKGYAASGSNFNYTSTTNHLDVPVLLKLKPAPFLHIVGGPMYSYMFNRSESLTGDRITPEQQQQISMGSHVNKNTLAAMTGLDINISKIVISGRVAWDLMNYNGDGSTSNLRYRNVFGQAAVGFRF